MCVVLLLAQTRVNSGLLLPDVRWALAYHGSGARFARLGLPTMLVRSPILIEQISR